MPPSWIVKLGLVGLLWYSELEICPEGPFFLNILIENVQLQLEHSIR